MFLIIVPDDDDYEKRVQYCIATTKYTRHNTFAGNFQLLCIRSVVLKAQSSYFYRQDYVASSVQS